MGADGWQVAVHISFLSTFLNLSFCYSVLSIVSEGSMCRVMAGLCQRVGKR